MPTEDIKWIAFFSQTGAEIADIAEKIGRWPDRIITNERPEHLRTIDPRIEKRHYWTFRNYPNEENYLEVLEFFPDALVTLHGWLRIIPGYVTKGVNFMSKIYKADAMQVAIPIIAKSNFSLAMVVQCKLFVNLDCLSFIN